MENKIMKILDKLNKAKIKELLGVFSYFETMIEIDYYLQKDTVFVKTTAKLENDIMFLEKHKQYVPEELIKDYNIVINYLVALQTARKLI